MDSMEVVNASAARVERVSMEAAAQGVDGVAARCVPRCDICGEAIVDASDDRVICGEEWHVHPRCTEGELD
jgi:hypothetical protein